MRQFVRSCAVVLLIAAGLSPARAADLFFDSDGTKIRYTDQGPRDGDAVLLVHGFAANIEFQWGPVIPSLVKDERRVVAFDFRGHGKSDKPRDPQAYGLAMIDDAARLLEHLQIERAHVVGYSMGAGLAGRFAAKYPEQTRSLTMGGAGLLPDEKFTRVFRDLVASLEQKGSMAPLILALTPPGVTPPTEFQLRTVDVMMMSSNDPRALAAMIRGFLPMLDEDAKQPPEHWRKSIEAPVLAIVGGDDPLLPTVRDTSKLLVGSKYVVIPHTDHITAYMSPKFAASLNEFFAAVETNHEGTKSTKEISSAAGN